jgi:hypothetical protein
MKGISKYADKRCNSYQRELKRSLAAITNSIFILLFINNCVQIDNTKK